MAQQSPELKQALNAFRHSFVMAGFFSLFINFLMLVPPLYMLQLYDRVLTSKSEETLLALTLIVVALFVVMGVLQFIRSRILIRIGAKLDQNMNSRLFHAMFQRSLYDPSSSSAQPISDLSSLRQFLTGQGLIAFFDSPWILVFLGVLFLFHVWMGLFGIFAAVVLFILTLANEYATRGFLQKASQDNVQSQNFASHNLRNAEVVHAMGMEPQVRERWMDRHLGFLSGQAKASDRSAILTNLSRTLRIMFQSLMLGLGAYLAINQQVTPGMMIAGSIILSRALAPLDMLIGSWQGFSAARSAYKRLQDLLEKVPPEGSAMSLPAPEGHVEVEQVIAVPPGGQNPALRGINFSVASGEAVGVVGPSAAGKSSLARVLLGVWSTRAGTVRLDGADVSQWNREELGPHVGYLPQDIELFEGTVAQNIARFGEVDSDKVVEAARLAGVHDMILHLPNGYDTMVGAAGGVLSAGQRQRVGLARAIYGDPAMVVLDEPNSNLDDQGEAALVEAVKALKQRGVTLFLITHRMNILSQMDKLLVLKEGQAAMFGPTGEVLAKLSGDNQRLKQEGGGDQGSGQPKVRLRSPGEG
jgi:ATP-binding cassette subfamily C protein EexD